ncbi:MAG TPA: dihydrofolate reductase family protein [Chloroflexota bacterium]|nr:dihydrofolate reductase family protein [Chloroflexota bacterium]
MAPERPRVTVSYAQTLDGRLATRSGSSRWISGEESLVFCHQMRASHDAIMVGLGTVLHDNPRLNVRLAPGRDPLRVVVDSRLSIPSGAAVLSEGAARGTLLAATRSALPERRAELAALGAEVVCGRQTPQGQVDLDWLLCELGARGIRTVMVEGGARLITNLLRARLVDRLTVTIAPKILGSGIEAVGDLGLLDLADSVRLDAVQVERYGPDLVLDARLVYAPAPVLV